MSRPSPEQLETALQEAARLREQGEDEHFIGKSLLNLNYRIEYLERVMRAAKEFLHSGLGGKEQTDLIRAIEKAEKAAAKKDDDDKALV